MQLVRDAGPASRDALDALGDAVAALVRAHKHAARHPSHGALPVLELALSLEHGERRLGELAAQRGVNQSVVSRQVCELEARGLVARRADPTDARAALVGLTTAGRAVLDDAARARRQWLHDTLAPYPEGDVRAAARLVAALADELQHHFALEEGHQA